MVRKGYTLEQIVDKPTEGEALLIASTRGHPARANDSNSNLTSGIITGDRSLAASHVSYLQRGMAVGYTQLTRSTRMRASCKSFAFVL